MSSLKKIGSNRLNHDVKTEKSPIPNTFRLLFILDVRYLGRRCRPHRQERWCLVTLISGSSTPNPTKFGCSGFLRLRLLRIELDSLPV